jgi:hypothetical protein
MPALTQGKFDAQPRLANPAGSDQCDEAAVGAGEQVTDAIQLGGASDERRWRDGHIRPGRRGVHRGNGNQSLARTETARDSHKGRALVARNL